jgi:hypothetical protein
MSKFSDLLGTAAAHLEHIAERDDIGRGRERRSLYQQRENKQRLLRMSSSMKRALAYINTVDDRSVDLGRVQYHLFDLIQDGGAAGSAYVRGVTTLKCILLHQDCNVDTFVNRPKFNNPANVVIVNGANNENGENADNSQNVNGNGTIVVVANGQNEEENATNNTNAEQSSSSSSGNGTQNVVVVVENGNNGEANANEAPSNENNVE